MKPEGSPEPFRAAFKSVQRLLRRHNDRGAIIGGIAVAFLGRPRFTADVDAVFLLSVDQIPEFLDIARSESILPRIQDAAEFARQNRVQLMKHEPSEINIDNSLGMLPFEEELVDRAAENQIGDLLIRLPTAEDLIIMKAVAHRSKEQEDIQMIVDKQANHHAGPGIPLPRAFAHQGTQRVTPRLAGVQGGWGASLENRRLPRQRGDHSGAGAPRHHGQRGAGGEARWWTILSSAFMAFSPCLVNSKLFGEKPSYTSLSSPRN